MPRMTGKQEPVEVMVILESGKTFHFKTSLGDTIAMQHVETQIGRGPSAVPHEYYTLTLVEGRKDAI